MTSVSIRIGGRTLAVDASSLAKWFPMLVNAYPYYYPTTIDSLIAEVRMYIGGSTSVPIRTEEITQAIRALFEQLKWNTWGDSTTERVVKMLEEMLRDERSGSNYLGVYKTRHRFMILCVLARTTSSIQLARALSTYLESKTRRILEHEERAFIREWSLGLRELRGLIHEYELRGLMEAFQEGLRDETSYNPYPTIVAPRHYTMPRLALPAPPVRRCRSLDRVRSGWPGYPTAAWQSPRMSPMEYPPMIGCGDDWEEDEIEDLKDRVNRLEREQGLLTWP
jgi:hypothetical protein